MTSFAQRLGPSQLPAGRRTTGTATASFDTKRASAVSAQATPRISYDFASIPLHAPAEAGVQAKLEVGSAADTHEQEADRVANEVMRMSEPQAGSACACGGRCPKCQASQAQPGRKPAGETAAPPAVGEVLRSSGQALDPGTRASMESRFGYDFGSVRVHADTAAAASARSVNARAYTAGRDIAFASGEYAPGTAEGGRLLAHELAHVVQQSGGGAVVQRAPLPGKPAGREPAKPAPVKPGNRVADLRAKSAEVQSKLQEFSGLKEWRGEFHASNDEKLRQISKLTRELSELKQEWRESQEKWYVFEHESSQWIYERLERVGKQLDSAYWNAQHPADAEKTYELQSQKMEAGLLKEQAAIIAEVGGLDKAGAPPSQSQYESLLARLNKLSVGVDQMRDAEIRAQVKYTGSGPVSRAR